MENQELIQVAKIDNKAPSFELPAYNPKTDSEEKVSLEWLKGKWSVLFFYPADFTFVCPTELKDMADNEERFKELWVEVLAASTDTVFSHKAWIKHERLMESFPYKMLADHSTKVSALYNLLNEETWIAGRWTFIIDPDLIIRGIEVTSDWLWRNSEELIRKIEALQFMRWNPWIACPAKWMSWAKTLSPSLKIVGKVADELEK